MADPASLSHAFMRAHPAAAAQVLEAVAAADAAALLERTPARLGAAVLGAMLPAAAARSLAALDDERALALLAEMGAQPVVVLLRRIAEPRRSRLLAGLPGGVAFASRLLLGFPEDTVGAWADPDVIALAPETRADAALERARRTEADAARVFVVGAGQRLEGWLELATLVRAPQAATLDTLMARPQALLAAHTPLAGAAGHPGWRHVSALPVVEAHDRLLGVLTHDALARALARAGGEARGAADESLPGMLARAYWEALAALVQAGASALPATRAVDGRGNER